MTVLRTVLIYNHYFSFAGVITCKKHVIVVGDNTINGLKVNGILEY
jgi:hypothetical protein